jgi:chromosome segregation ATPase
MAYSEIINEIQEQIDDITAAVTANAESITEKQAEIDELVSLTPGLQDQLAGLNQLKVNAQSLIDSQKQVDINLNVNVNAGQNTTMTVASGSSIPQDGPFS